MRFGVIFDVDRNQAVMLLAAGLAIDPNVESKEAVEGCIKNHLSYLGMVVWPPYAKSTPSPEQKAELIKKADALLTKYWPNYAQEQSVWPYRTEDEEAEWRFRSPDDEDE
jgi:hypothetical protein